jgi:hypothetical protein
MGGGEPENDAVLCSGDDVLQDLDDVFGHPHSQKYKDAKAASLALFEAVSPHGANNYQQLHDAYKAAYQVAGVAICPNWEPYLATLSPDNIFLIAQTRGMALVMDLPMTTKTHDPTQGGHGVIVSVGNGSVTIDSPYGPGIFYRNRRRNRNLKP